MRICIITFHWGTNYGAVLQAFALQEFLKKNNEVSIIDYVPKYKDSLVNNVKTLILYIINPDKIKNEILKNIKEKRLSIFRKSYLNLTKTYSSLEEMKAEPPEYDVYICGSDQVWNQNFVRNGEGKGATSYFLDFVQKDKIKIAYAVSFGCEEYDIDVIKKVKPLIEKINHKSVREKSGVKLLKNIGISNVLLMPDPTLLLDSSEYENIFKLKEGETDKVFIYALHEKQKEIKRVIDFIVGECKEKIIYTGSVYYSVMSIKEWLEKIKNSKYVLTNSYHGVLFSIIFKRPFLAMTVEEKGSDMNDRIYSLLGQLGLSNRIVNNYDKDLINRIINEKINWGRVDKEIANMRKDADSFLGAAILL
jgi:hypothetical protein